MHKKRGSKIFTAIISFLLGFILAIGAIVGAGFYIAYADLDQLFALVGFSNSDENGDQYINTDENNGGFASVMDLLNRLQTLSGDIGNLTIDELETMFPALDGLTQQIYDLLADYAEVDYDELEATKFADLPDFINETIMSIEPAVLLENLNYAEEMKENAIVWAIMAGCEAQYVYEDNDENGDKYPVYYDEYVYSEEFGKYYRTEAGENGDTVYPDGVAADDWITETARKNDDGEIIYRQYYFAYESGDTVYYIVTKADSNGDYVFPLTSDRSADLENDDKNADKIYDTEGSSLGYGDSGELSGNYYYDNDGNKVKVNVVTVRTLTEDAFAPLYNMPATDVIGDSDVVVEILSGISIGEIMDKSVDLGERINSLSVCSVVDVEPDSAILMYIAYNVTDVKEIDGVYTGVYAKGTEDECAVTLTLDSDGYVSGVYGEDGGEIAGVTVEGIGDQVDGVMDVLTVGDLMDIEPTNTVMAYLGYKISNVTDVEGETYLYTASYELEDGTLTDCFVVTALNSDGTEVIERVYYEQNGENVEVSCCTVGGISDAVADIRVTAFLDVKADDAILCYLGYGITDLVQVGEYEYTAVYYDESDDSESSEKDCYVTVNADGTVTSVYYYDDNGNGNKVVIAGTKIDEVGDRISSLTDRLALGDVMNVYATDGNIMTFIAFSVTDVQGDAEKGYTGVYYDSNGDRQACTVNVAEDGKITSVTVGSTVQKKIKISDVSSQVDRLTDTLAIGDLIDIDPDSAIMMYIAYNITGVEKVVDGAAGRTYYTGTYNERDVIIDVEGEEDAYKVVSVTYQENGETVTVYGITVNKISDQISGITENLTLGELINIDTDNDFILGSLSDKKLSELPDEINKLTIQQLYADAIYVYGYTYESDNSKEGDSYAILYEVVNREIKVDSDGLLKVVAQDPAEGEIAFSTDYIYYYADGDNLVLVGKLTSLPDDGKTYYTFGEYGKIEFNSNYIYYYKDESGNLVLVNNDDLKNGTRGKLTEFNDEYTYYTYGESQGVWKILLCDDGNEKLWTLDDLGNLMENAKQSIGNATLLELADAGIIAKSELYTDETYTTLKTVQYGDEKVILGNLTITGLIKLVSNLAS